ncbi:MAG: hypothetical protein EBU27_00850, partial [Opitutae bacterium]|nr:hypothetical protein [Opitutae bacterium]
MKKLLPCLLCLSLGPSIFSKVEVIEISPSNTAVLPGGKEADGIIGDFVLRNSQIEVTIGGGAPNRKANMGAFWGANGVTPGCLYDLTLRGTNNDQLTIFSPSKQQGRISYIRIGDDQKSVITYVSPALSGGLTKTHIYSVEEGDYGISVTSTFQPGTEVIIRRFLCVGTSPAQAYGRAMAKLGEVGKLSLTITDPEGKAISTARVDLKRDGKSVPAYPDAKGEIEISLPPGEWQLTTKDNGREALDTKIVISKDKATNEKITLGEQSGIHFAITKENGDPTPCKAQIIGVEGTSSPRLGPVDRAHGCNDQYHSENGQFSIGLAPGKYKIIITRGIEHDHYEKMLEVKKGKFVTIQTSLIRSVKTTGWVSTDFHNHSTPSGDNICGTPDRLINLAAEHIEFAPTTEHNRIMDWTPTIKSLGLAGEISTIPGMELTGSGPHLNAFPLTPKHHHQDGGAPTWTKDPRVNALNLKNHSGHHPSGWIHINHPDMIENFIDRNKDGNPDGGYPGILSLIDAIETENYRAAEILHRAPYKISRRASREQVYIVREFVWLQMLNRGMKTWGIAVSDAHTVHGNGVGGWRTYVRCSTDDPSKIDWREISRRAKGGQMILTTGPYLEVSTTDGVLSGGLARANDFIDLKVRVQCPSWIDIDRIQVLVNGRPVESLNFTRTSHQDWFSDGIVKFDRTVSVPLSED